MKKVFVKIVIMAMIFSSCEKQEVGELSRQTIDKDLIISKALRLSQQHDSLLTQLLLSERKVIRQKVKSSTNDESLDLDEIFDVIEEVTGVRPFVVKSSDEAKQFSKANNNGDDYPIFNLDEDNISLSGYANSPAVGKYLEHVDIILQDSLLSVGEKISQICDVQNNVKGDSLISVVDFENFFNTTEVLKGSMTLWNNYYNETAENQNVNPLYKAKPLKQWSFFSKLGFVAAADAVGAVLGTFMGGFLIVNGVPIYVPSGPQGACVGLATLSVIAGNMVGW
jgi:hypothetical protein